jgi:hypothetical protein
MNSLREMEENKTPFNELNTKKCPFALPLIN